MSDVLEKLDVRALTVGIVAYTSSWTRASCCLYWSWVNGIQRKKLRGTRTWTRSGGPFLIMNWCCSVYSWDCSLVNNHFFCSIFQWCSCAVLGECITVFWPPKVFLLLVVKLLKFSFSWWLIASIPPSCPSCYRTQVNTLISGMGCMRIIMI